MTLLLDALWYCAISHLQKPASDAEKTVIHSRDKINQDLQKLIEIKKEPKMDRDDDDLPPLLQVY